MSVFLYPIEIGDSEQNRFETIQAWVDSGSSYTWVPSSILTTLGFTPSFKRRFVLADGGIVEKDVCQVPLRIGHETIISLVVFGDENSEPLLGATALEDFGLGIDPINHTLIPIISKALSLGWI
jgi:clan AA aspartic protease